MRVAFKGQVPKDLAFADEIEDAMAFAPEAGRVAISDGASESYDSRSWARLLVRRFVADTAVDGAWLNAAITEYRSQRDFSDLPWSHQAAFDRGSYATLLAVEHLPQEQRLKVHCVGDSVAMLIDGLGNLQRKFSYLRAAAFRQRPNLLSTDPARNTSFKGWRALELQTASWRLFPGEPRFVLCMTDATGEWALQHAECGRPVWKELLALDDQPGLDALVAEARESRDMRVDDVTLVRLSFDD